MEQQVDRLLEKTWAKLRATPDNARLMIAISGIPGSGKTGLASMMAQRINQLYSPEHPGAPPIATAIPMDGYHLTRAELASMPDPEFAAARRGAAFTFDGEKFLRLVQALRDPLTVQSPSLYAPSFDHAVKDPIENDIAIPASCRAIFFEGNYLSLDKPPWNQAAKLMDELWFVDVDFETARKRLLRRHVQAGIAKNVDEADKRARENDLVNGKEIVDRRMDVQEIITSYYDGRWDA